MSKSKKDTAKTKKNTKKKTTKKESTKKTTSTSKTTSRTKTKTTSQKDKVQKIATITVLVKDHDDKKGGHPHVILETIDNKHISVGLTSDKYKGKNHPNIELEINPLAKKGKSYMKRQGTVDKVSTYTHKRNGKMTEKDHEKTLKIGARAKEKYIKEKKITKKTVKKKKK